MMPITMAKPGERVQVKRLAGKDEVRRHLNELGLVEGDYVTVIQNNKADESYRLKILLTKTIPPIKRYIAALNNKVLLILNGCLNDFSDYRPQVFRKLVIIFGCKISVSAANKPHLQMVN